MHGTLLLLAILLSMYHDRPRHLLLVIAVSSSYFRIRAACSSVLKCCAPFSLLQVWLTRCAEGVVVGRLRGQRRPTGAGAGHGPGKLGRDSRDRITRAGIEHACWCVIYRIA